MDTRDLDKRREELKADILASFHEEFPQYEDMTENFEDIRFEEEEIESWVEYWQAEIDEIDEIDVIESENSEFTHGVHLIEEDDFIGYVKDYVEELGILPEKTSSIITDNIDWEGVASDLETDYITVTYQGKSYKMRSY